MNAQAAYKRLDPQKWAQISVVERLALIEQVQRNLKTYVTELGTEDAKITRSMSNSNEESAQTYLHVLLSDDAPNHSGAYFSQHSVLYRDKECRKGGWPMETPNPNARDMDTARKLVEISRELVGLVKAK